MNNSVMKKTNALSWTNVILKKQLKNGVEKDKEIE